MYIYIYIYVYIYMYICINIIFLYKDEALIKISNKEAENLEFKSTQENIIDMVINIKCKHLKLLYHCI